MKLKQNKKAATTELIFLFSLFGIVLILSVFYVWIQKNITEQAKTQAESIAADLERRIFFSTLINEHGTDIANKDEDEVETIIEKYSEKQAKIEQGSYDAICTTQGIDKECTLEITINYITSAVWTATFFVPGINVLTAPVYILFKAIGIDIIDQTKTSAYLPMTGNKAMKFTLDITVEGV